MKMVSVWKFVLYEFLEKEIEKLIEKKSPRT